MRPQFQALALLVLTTGLVEEHVLKSVAEARVALDVVAEAKVALVAVLKAVAANTVARVVKIFDIF
jgi:hypothetical protein